MMLTIVVEIRLSFTIDYGGIGRDGLKKMCPWHGQDDFFSIDIDSQLNSKLAIKIEWNQILIFFTEYKCPILVLP